MKSRTVYGLMLIQRGKNMQQKIRLQIVRYGQKYGIKKAATHFGCSKNTVKLWLRRYEEKGSAALVNCSRAPKHIPHKTSETEEKKIVRYRKKVPCYGPKRLRYFFDIKASEGAIARVLKTNKLTRKRRKKYQRKQDLREVKAKYLSLTQYQMDVKHLCDIPYYWPQMMKKRLPKYQYTLRDVKSGMIVLGYAQEYSELYSSLFIEEYFKHIENNGIELKAVTVQTDNGSEFGAKKRDIKQEGFTHAIEKHQARHQYIPPGMSNANADVESVHATIEQELFDLEDFASYEDFLVKTQAYQYFYNLARPNFSKKTRTPREIIEADLPEINKEILNYPVQDIDALFRKKYFVNLKHKGGQYLPVLPEFIFPT